jgi:hypothetical protein
MLGCAKHLSTGKRSGRDRRASRRDFSVAADLLAEPFWSLVARAALALDECAAVVCDAPLPAAGEISGSARAMPTVGPVSDHLAELQSTCRP